MIRGTVHPSRKTGGTIRKRHARDTFHPHRRGARRANAPVAPDDGRSVRQARGFLHPGPDTVRGRPRGFRGTGPALVDPAAYPARGGKLTPGPGGLAQGGAAGQPATRHQQGPGHRPAAPWRRVHTWRRDQAHASAGVRSRQAKTASASGRQGGAGGLRPTLRTADAGRAGQRGDRPRGRGAPRMAEPAGARPVRPRGQARDRVHPAYDT